MVTKEVHVPVYLQYESCLCALRPRQSVMEARWQIPAVCPSPPTPSSKESVGCLRELQCPTACSTVITLVVISPPLQHSTSAECARFSYPPPPTPAPPFLPCAVPQLVRELLRRGMSCQGLLDGDARSVSPESDAVESISHLSLPSSHHPPLSPCSQ